MDTPIVAVLGGGQLGRMLGLAAIPLGVRCRFLDPTPHAAAGATGELVVGELGDRAALARLTDGAAVATWEWEGVPAAAAEWLSYRLPVHPPPLALAIAQDRLEEKRTFHRLGIGTAPFAPVDDRADLDAAVALVGLPAVLKTRRGGYDGKGQWTLSEPDDVDTAWARLGGVPLLLEGWVPFDRELSVVACRGTDGDIVTWPVFENVHREGILRTSRALGPGDGPASQDAARECARRLLDDFDYVGTMCLELFAVGDTVLANEVAPRVHNSGHGTIEGAVTSQFENHLRAVLGWPLGSTAAVGPTAMVNCIGAVPDPVRVLAVAGAHLHDYGKQARPGRKVGHVTIVADDADALASRVEQVEALVTASVGA